MGPRVHGLLRDPGVPYLVTRRPFARHPRPYYFDGSSYFSSNRWLDSEYYGFLTSWRHSASPAPSASKWNILDQYFFKLIAVIPSLWVSDFQLEYFSWYLVRSIDFWEMGFLHWKLKNHYKVAWCIRVLLYRSIKFVRSDGTFLPGEISGSLSPARNSLGTQALLGIGMVQRCGQL